MSKPDSSDSATLPAAAGGLEPMEDGISAALQDSGRTEEVDPAPRTGHSVTFRIPLSALVESALADERLSDTDLGDWWRSQRRYTLNYEPFADGSPGFVLIDRHRELIVWAREGPQRCMRFRSWQTGVSTALAREVWDDDE